MEGGTVARRGWSGLSSMPVSPALLWAARAAGVLVFVGVLLVRGGPISAQNDARAVTLPTTAVSHGHWRLAEEETLVPDPPGYPLLAAPVVAGLRSWIGSPTWCSNRPLPAAVAGGPQAAFYRSLLQPCADRRTDQRGALPPWYRSQAVLGVVAWVVLVAGVQLLLRAVHGRPTMAEVAAALGLAVLPATSDALIESFHPQDLLSVGLACAALAQALRRRWVAVGVLFGLALLCKQFTALALLPALVWAPDRRARALVVGLGAAVVLLGIAPFWLADRVDTWHALSGDYVEGAGIIRSATVVGLLGIAEARKLAISRDAPVLVSALVCLAVWWKAKQRLHTPVALLGLVLACMATRLVFEVSMPGYYLLALSVFLLVVDLAAGRPPLWTVVWVLSTRYVALGLPSVVGPGWVAAALLASSLVAVAIGLGPVAPGALRLPARRSAPADPRPAP